MTTATIGLIWCCPSFKQNQV